MERKFLKDLGVSDDAVEKIMAEYGKAVEKSKQDAADYKQQYEDTKKALKAFDGVDIADLQDTIADLRADLDAKDKDYAAKLDERDFDAVFRGVTGRAKARNHDVLIAALGKDKVDGLKVSKNREADIEAAVNALRADKEQAYLFEVERAPRAVGPTPGAAKDEDTAKSKANDGLRSLFGKGE